MQQLVLIIACLTGTVLCITRRKQYGHSYFRMMLIFTVFSISGSCGSHFGALIADGLIDGRRLYGLMMADTVMLFIMAFLLRIKRRDLGDYIAPPILSSCVGAKLSCLIDGCCYGIVLFYDAKNEPVRFPSPIFEILLWVSLVFWLLKLEKKGSAKGMLWPLAMIWFGLTRFFADFLRGVPSEREGFFAGLPAGAFWSLVLTLMGLTYLFVSAKVQIGNNMSLRQYTKAIFGNLENE